MRSLRSRLFVIWVLSLTASLTVGLMLVGLYRQSSSAQLDRAAEAVAEACEQIADRYGFYAAGWAGPRPTGEDAAFREDLAAVVAFALGGRPGITGGIWQQDAGPLAGTEIPEGELREALGVLVTDVLLDGQPAATRLLAQGQTSALQACGLRGPLPGLAAWAVAVVPDTPGQARLRGGLGVLLALMLGVTGLLGWVVAAWSRRIGGIEAALAAHEAGALPRLQPTGERELDRIVAALNSAGARLEQARENADSLAARVALAERLAALGRVAAGVAHEIRNPIAAMRLRAENALAGDDARRRAALEAILGQVARLERLAGELLAMTQHHEAVAVPTDISGLLEACAADHRDGRVAITLEAAAGSIAVDTGLLRRALDSLVQNAVQHAPPGGHVVLRGVAAEGRLRISVIDDGPGVPAALRTTLFEPFVTGRPDGTGLGLAIARELAEALGGELRLDNPGPGAVFTIDVPCR